MGESQVQSFCVNSLYFFYVGLASLLTYIMVADVNTMVCVAYISGSLIPFQVQELVHFLLIKQVSRLALHVKCCCA